MFEFKIALLAETQGIMIHLMDNFNYRLEVANDDEKFKLLLILTFNLIGFPHFQMEMEERE